MAKISEVTDDPSQVFTLDTESINEYLSDNTENEKSISFTLPNGNEYNLILEPHSIVSPDCILNRSTANGLIREPMPQMNSFKGTLSGEENSAVLLINTASLFSIIIFTETDRYEISSLKNTRPDNNLFFFVESSLTEGESLACEANSCIIAQKPPIERFLEVGVDADYAFFQQVGDNSAMEMAGRMAIASFEYECFFNVKLVIVQAHVWETMDTYQPIVDANLGPVKSFWNEFLFCVHKDVVHLFTLNEDVWYRGLANTGHVIGANRIDPIDLPVSVNSTFNESPISENIFTIMHELGHNFGAIHLEDVPVSNIGQECCNDQQELNVLMCNEGYGNSNDYIRISDYTQNIVNNLLNGQLDGFGWFDEPVSLDCQMCEYILLTTDNLKPTIDNQSNCQTGNSISNFNIEVCNGCVEGSKEIEVILPEEMELIEAPGFTVNPDPGGGTRISLEYDFAEEECQIYSFQTKTIGSTSQITVRANLITDISNISDELIINPIQFLEIAPLPGDSDIRLSNIPTFPLIWQLIAPNNSGKNFTLSGTLIIDRLDNCENPFYFEDSQIFMTPGSKIIIEEGIEFQIRNTHIYGCDGMWEGIEVEGPGSTSAARLIIENSLIEDAEIAIDAQSGAELSVTDTRFNLNRIGINRTGDWPVGVDFGEFHSNTFDCDDVLKTPYAGQKALYGLGVNNVTSAFTNSSADSEQRNVFRNMQMGVLSVSSNLIVSNSSFSGIRSNLSPNFAGFGDAVSVLNGFGKQLQVIGLGVQGGNPPTFLDCDGGVYARRSNVRVTNARFSNVTNGVEVERSQLHRISVINNHFFLNDYPIKMYQNAPLISEGYIIGNKIISPADNTVGIGIYESNPTPANQSWTISSNEIALFGNSETGISINSAENVTVRNNDINISHPLTADYTGIYLAGSTRSNVSCNNVTNQFNLLASTEPDPTSTEGIGIQVLQSPGTALDCNATLGTTIGINYWGMCDNSENKGNRLQKNAFGLLYGLFPNEGNAFTGPQNDFGNLWSGEFDGSGARHLGNLETTLFSKFTVDAEENQNYLPIWDAEGDWFENDPENNQSFSCTQIETCGKPNLALKVNNLNEKISLGILPTEGYSESINWTGQQHLFRRASFEEETRLAYQNFYNSQAGNSIAQLNENFAHTKDLYDVEDKPEWVNQQELLNTSFDRVTQYQTDLFATENNAEKIELINQIQLEKQTLDEEQNTVAENTQQSFLSEEQNNQTVSLSANSEKVYEQNWGSINLIIANQINDYTSDLSEVEIGTLTQIANQCILSGGDAVLVARSLLAKSGNYTYNELELCNTAEIKEAAPTVEKPASIFVYPNPTKAMINIAFNNHEFDQAELRLRDPLGAIILTKTISSNVSGTQLDIARIPSGIYFLEVYLDHQDKHVEKIVIVK